MKPKLLTVLCGIYVAMILYGTLIPFDLTADVDVPLGHFQRERSTWPANLYSHRRSFAANLAMFLPLGLLVALGKADRSRLRAVLAAVVVAGAVSISVEALQLWSPTRTAEVADLLANSAGGMIGGLLATALGPAAKRRFGDGWPASWRLRPARPVAAAICLLLVADAADPFYPVLRKGLLLENLRNSHIALAEGLAVHSWHHWLICRVGMYAVLASLLAASCMDGSRRRWVRGGALAIAFALATETCKPLIEDRVANLANVLIAACGAVVGVAVGMALHGRLSLRAKAGLAAILLVGYVSYRECRPPREGDRFSLTWSPPSMKAKVPTGTEWFPAHSFATGKKRVRFVRPIVRILAVMAAFTFALSLRRRQAGGSLARRIAAGALLAGAIGLSLQLFKLLIPERGPNIGKLVAFPMAGALGAWLYWAAVTLGLSGEKLFPVKP